MQKLVKELIKPFLIEESALVGSGGIIAGAPDPKKVKKVRKQLDKDRKKDEHYKIEEFINKPKMKKALQKLIDKNVLPKNYAKNISKLQHFLTNNPMVMTQLLKLLGENINENKKEFVIWGIPPDKRKEDILYTKAKSHSEAKKIIKILTAKHGVTKARIQVLDMAQDPKDIWKADKLFKEETSKIKKVVGIYGGRFQPFGPHHKKTYEWMKKKFDDVYITTSNIKKPPKHPMNFKEKVRHMTKMGIPSSKIIQERTPYVATNTMKKFDKETTAVVYAFGAKEGSRLKGGKYFKDYKKNKKSLEGFWKHGYVLTAPHVSMKAAGMEVSGTTMRKLLGSPEYVDDRERRFKKYFGYFDKSVFNMMIGKFKKLFEDFKLSNNLIEEFISEVDVSKIIKEGSSSINFGTDDGPPTFYKGFSDYKKESKKWVDSMAEKYGWEVVNYILSKGAVNPDFDYTLKYNVVPAVAFGRKGTGEYGSRFGVKDPIGEYKDQLGNVLATVGWEVIKWMGITPDGKSYTGVEVETPIFPGVGAPIGKPASAENTERAAQEADKTSSGMPKLSTLKERINLNKEVKLILEQGHKAVSLATGYVSTFDTTDAMKKAIKKGTHAKPGSAKAKAAEKKKPKIKMPKIKKPKLDPEKMKKARQDRERKEKLYRDNDREPNMVDGVDEIRNEKDLEHYLFDFEEKANTVEDMDEYDLEMGDQYEEQMSGLSREERQQVKEDAKSWKKLGGYEAIQDAIESGEISEQDIRDRNERMSNRAHETVTRVEQPIERGISIPNESVDGFMERFVEGEDVEIPDESGHGSSGFSINGETARYFSKVNDPEETSILMRVEPNSNGEVRGLFIDGEPDTDYEEGEILRSSKSKAKVKKVERVKQPNGKMVIIITLQESDDLTEVYVKETEEKENILSKKYLEGPLNPEPHKKKVKEDIKPDIIKSFIIRNSLNTKVWDGDKLKPEIRKKLLIIAKNFFKDLELEPNVKLKDITLTGSISNYNWSKFSDVDLHLRIDFSQVDDDEDFVKNYVLAKKTIWNNKHDIKIYGFPVEVYVENLGDVHVASGLYSILKDEWIVVPKKKELQIDLQDIRSKAEGYLGSMPVLQKMMKDGKYEEVIKMVEKIQDKLKRMRSSGLQRGGEFSVENLAFKALRRSPFIGDIIQMKSDAYDKKMSMKEKLDLTEYVNLLISDKPYKGKELLLMGGAYGHMNHPFDDKNITFSDLKNIIILGLGGKLNREDGVTEKLDGQNLMISWKDGKLVTARNKGQLKNFGATSMDVSGVASKFAGRGDIRDAFVFAMKDLNKSIGSLSDKQKEKVFGNGKRWMNLEIMYPRSANVIDYDKAQIVFHGTLEYDESGTAIGQPNDSARMLAGMIKQVNQSVQKHYTIGKPQFLTVPKVQDFGKKKKTYLSRLNKLQKEYRLKDSDTLSKYHQSFWEEFIHNASKQHKAKISNKVLINLTKRWAFFDKSYKINDIKKDLKDSPKFLEWVRSFDKNDHLKWVSQNMKPFETLFFEVGAEILKNISGYIAASPQKAVQKIRKGVISAIKAVKSGGDVKKIQTLKHQIEKLESIGGLSSIVPSEGIVFKYKGKTYKFTGAFAPVNQILGLLRF